MKKVYLQGYGYVFWMTRDGTTFKKQETYPNYLYSIKPHPTDYQYALRLIYVSSLRYFQVLFSYFSSIFVNNNKNNNNKDNDIIKIIKIIIIIIIILKIITTKKVTIE